MSDNRRRYHAIKRALVQLCPTEPKGNQARHVHTLAAMVSGIVGSKCVHLPAIADRVPQRAKNESQVKRFYRWLKNERIDAEAYYLPYVEALLSNLAARGPLLLAIDGSEVGRQCMTLLVSVIYKKRALPIAWLVVRGTKGHLPEERHIALIERVHHVIPDEADVIFVGDGEFDGIHLQTTVEAYGWEYVCRTAKNVLLGAEGDQFAFTELGIEAGDCVGLPDVTFTREAYGPVLAIAWWEIGYQEPLYLITNMELMAEACYWYRRRYRIETFFSDQKSRGFNLDKSHIADPRRLARLMIAACLAYIWMIYLGVIAKRDDWVKIIHRVDRCDLSLFQLGLKLLEHFLDYDLPIPVRFDMLQFAESVR
jgi:hypothetical protein